MHINKSNSNAHLVLFNVVYKSTDDGSLLMALTNGHISNFKRTNRDIYKINVLQIGYWRTTILVLIHHQCTEFLEFLGHQALIISHQSKTRSTGMPLSVPHLANINFVRSGHLYHNDLQISKSQWGGLWDVKIFRFNVFWRSRTCSIVDRRICDYKHHAEAPDDTSWRSQCKAGLLLMGRHIMTIIYFEP